MPRLPLALTCAVALALTSACSGDGGADASGFVADAGPVDTGAERADAAVPDADPVDTGPADTGVDTDLDSGAVDTGVEPDATPIDSGPVDTGVLDTGLVPDAGPEDTGVLDTGLVPDAGPADTGAAPDAGPADTGAAPDAGPADTGVPPDAGPVDTGVVPDAGPAVPAYTIDGDLTEWNNPISVLVNPGYDGTGLWGADNRFQELRVDGDSNFLYLGFRFRASGNSCIIHMDTVTGGITSAAMLNAWPRLMTFPPGVDHFVAQYEGGALQFRDLLSATNAPNSAATYLHATTSAGAQRVTEVAIPWGALGLGAGPRTVTFYAGILGGDNFGGGDMAPNANSVPLATGNTIDSMNSFAQVFAQGFTVTIP